MVAPEAEVPEAVLRSPRYFSPGGFRIGSAARHRAQARGGQGEDQADLQQQIRLEVRGSPPLQTPMFTPRICQHGAGTPGVDIGIGRHAKAGETCIPGDVAGRDKEISLLYHLRQPDCQRPSWRHDSGTPSPFVVKLTATESSACICKKSLTESINDSNL